MNATMKWTERDAFLHDLQRLIRNTEARPSFKGKTKALRALKRIDQLSDLR